MNSRFVKIISSLLMGFYLMLLCSWMFVGIGRIRRHTHSEYMYNLKPFTTIKTYLQTHHFNTDIWVINLFGNIGVFIPFGILIPLIFGKKFTRSFLIFFIGLFSLELLQLLSKRGSFDVDDLILNSLGFLCGYGCFRMIGAWVNSKRKIQ